MYRVKCLECRKVADGESINQALDLVPHTEGCPSHRLGVAVRYDSIDLSVSDSF